MELRLVIVRVGGQEFAEITYESSAYGPDTYLKVSYDELVELGGPVLEFGDLRLHEVQGGFCNVKFKVGNTYRITALCPPGSSREINYIPESAAGSTHHFNMSFNHATTTSFSLGSCTNLRLRRRNG